MRKRFDTMIFAVLTLTLSFLATTAFGQESKSESLRKKNLTYYWIGNTCPSAFKNTEERFGFKVEGAGCIMTSKVWWHNRRVVRAINKVYGKKWFEKNIRNS